MVHARACMLSIAMCFASAVMAQTVNDSIFLPYSMGFEASGSDSVELASGLWHVNYGSQAVGCTDRWELGNKTRSEGKRSVYIMPSDTSLIPGHGQDANMQFIYRDMTFEAGRRYTISFDWLNSSATDSAAMYVGYFAYASGSTPSSKSAWWKIAADSLSGSFPSGLSSKNCTPALKGATTWQSYTFPTLTAVQNQTYRFYVAWANKGEVNTRGYAACFDNLQITDARCKAPKNIRTAMTACDTMLVTWEGTASDYDVKYRKTGTSQWSTASYYAAMGNQCIIEGLAEGSYEIRIRAVYYVDNQRIYSAFTKSEREVIVYCADKHCIDYTTLTAPNVTCASGSGYDGWSANPQVAYANVGVIDFGSGDSRSRHTTNWDRTEKDPRTGSRLSLVPNGALASVRLGNWETGAEAESVSYEYVVDSALSILLMRYAVVLEDPDHDANEQPRFTLEILDEAGQRIDPTCGFVNFAADSKAEGWNTYGDGYDKVTWKDWTTIGLHLDDYVGQTLTVRLATYDCSQSGHYGYAYFTLDCASATIETHSCGSNFRLEASAPSGFLYEWADDHGNVLGREQEINILTEDSMEYTCKLTNTENEDCYFYLSVMALPRFPIAQGTWKYNPKMCQNIVEFRDSSFVQTRYYGDTINHYDQKMASYEWEFLDGSGASSAMPNCQHTFPEEGGTFPVILRAWLAEGEDDCEDIDTIMVTVPRVGDSLSVAHEVICEGDRYTFFGKRIYESGIYVHRDTAWTGCVTTDSLYMLVARKNNINLPDVTLCAGEEYCVGDTCYTAGKDGYFTPAFMNMYGCDSMVTVYVHYKEPILPLIAVDQMNDSVDIATVYISGTGWEYYTIGDDPTHRRETMFQTTEDGKYEVTFYSDSTDNVICHDTATYTIVPPCLRGLIYQRWDDVLSIMNEQTQREQYPDAKHYYSFTSYQWMLNGIPIIGANKSYYYVGENGEKLNPNDTYTCVVVLQDGTTDETCEFKPLATAPESAPVQARKYIRGGKLVIETGDATYNAFGNRIK